MFKRGTAHAKGPPARPQSRPARTTPRYDEAGGGPPVCTRELAIQVIGMRRQGMSYMQIVNSLNAHHVLKPSGQPGWTKSSVVGFLRRQHVKEIARSMG